MLLLVSKHRSKSHIAQDLEAFFGAENSVKFTEWLWEELAPYDKTLKSSKKGNRVEVHTLDFSDNNFADAGIVEIAEKVSEKKFFGLKVLNLSKTNVQAYGISKLAHHKDNEIETLYLNNNNLCEDAAPEIALLIKGWRKSLRKLYLQNNKIEQGCKSIGHEIMVADDELTVLDLSNNNIGDDGARAMSIALNSKNSLKQLILKANNITAYGVFKISEVLAKNKQLTLLDLSDNIIGDSGAKELAQCLKVNETLKELRLDSNQKKKCTKFWYVWKKGNFRGVAEVL